MLEGSFFTTDENIEVTATLYENNSRDQLYAYRKAWGMDGFVQGYDHGVDCSLVSFHSLDRMTAMRTVADETARSSQTSLSAQAVQI